MNQKEYNILKEIVNKYDVVCIDLFDTLLDRVYSTKYSFYIVADYLLSKYHINSTIEKLANSLSFLFSNCKLPQRFKIKNTYYHYNIDKFEDYEIFEKNIITLFLNAEIKNTKKSSYAEELLSSINKNVVIVSDFYFGESFLRQLLTKNGIVGDYELLVSCDCNKSKEDGSIYHLFESHKSKIMIGDNYNSDYKQSLRAGFNEAFHIDANINYHNYSLFDDKYCQQNKIIEKLVVQDNRRYAANFFIPVFSFCKRLFSRLNDNDTIFFLSREGQFLKKCFDLFIEKHKYKTVFTDYLYVSRMSLILWSNDDIINKTYDGVVNVINNKTYLEQGINKVSTLLEYLGFSKEEIQHTYKIYSYKDGTDFSYIWNNSDFKNLLIDKRNNVKKYLDKKFANKDTIILCDVGWQGTMQNIISTIFPDLNIVGYYLGTSKCIGENNNSRKIGLLYDYCDDLFFTNGDFLRAAEMVLRADHGAVINYHNNDPILVNDASVAIYNNYSKERQEIMFNKFKETLELNEIVPLQVESIDNSFKSIFQKWPESSRIIDNYNFFYQLTPNQQYQEPSYHRKSIIVVTLKKARNKIKKFARIIIRKR